MTFNNASQSNQTSILDLNSSMSSCFKQSTTLDTRLADTVSVEHRSHSSALTTDNSRHRFNLREFFNRAFSSENQSTPFNTSEAMLDVDDQLSRGWAGRGSRSPQVSSQLTAAFKDSSSTALVNSIDPSGTLLSPTSTPNTVTVNTGIIAGTLRADHFTLPGNTLRTVISGNGNVDFGAGFRDLINLTNVTSNSVQFNLAGVGGGTGVAFNPGNGTRIFDAINFNNGQQILFEGIDTIQFADSALNLSVTPNDPLFSQQWNLHMMGVQNAWRFTTGSSSVAIGVEDTGLGVDAFGRIHPDLRFTNFTPNNHTPDDFFRTIPGSEQGPRTTSHGTGVQGIIAAASNNGIGISGINWNSPVIAADVLDGNSGDFNLAQATLRIVD